MPRATVSSDTKRFDLKSLEGGFVELRRMSYGQKQQRQDLAMKMAFEGSGKKGDTKATAEMSSEAIAVFEFKSCIVQHNLFKDDEETIALDLSNPRDVRELDPRVGEEISTYIDSMNNFEQEELDDLGNGSSGQS